MFNIDEICFVDIHSLKDMDGQVVWKVGCEVSVVLEADDANNGDRSGFQKSDVPGFVCHDKQEMDDVNANG